MIRKSKRYVRPRKAYERSRIDEENELVKKYGLKSKREIWKTLAKVNYFRRRAKALAKSTSEEQEVLFKKLQEIGLDIKSIADVLALNVEALLERRLQTVVFRKGLANTPNHARQLVTHKKVSLADKIINKPSYLVPVALDNNLKVDVPQKRLSPHDKAEKKNTHEIEQEVAA